MSNLSLRSWILAIVLAGVFLWVMQSHGSKRHADIKRGISGIVRESTTAPTLGTTKPAVVTGSDNQLTGDDCPVWNCTCQGMSDLFGSWHYREFGDVNEAQIDWWMKKKCNTHPKTATEGWEIFKRIKSLQIYNMTQIIQDKINKLKTLPDDPRLANHVALYKAVSENHDCFSDPAWPSEKECVNKNLSNRMAFFVKLSLGYARPGKDDIMLD
eukprot:m.187688 g.187688  ORF g.187688 m.187688 type:complete len:213 (-) comp32312_c0_seq4:1716-2354(-)